jgi:hypothetical protein
MTSMTYDPRCETLRFAWRSDPLVFAGFALRSDGEAKRTWIRLVKGPRASGAREAWRRWRPLGAFWTLLRDAMRGIAPQDEGLEAPRLRSLRQATGRLSRPLAAAQSEVPRRAAQSRKSCAKAQLSAWNRSRAQTCARPHSRDFTTGRSSRWVRPRPAPCRLRAQGRPSRSARAPRGLRPSPVVRPAQASARR